MAWTTRAKDLGISKVVPHPSSDPNVIGRAPTITTINFTPLEMFGATARCSFLNVINPAAITAESQMMAALIEQYVDDISPDFAILATADLFKDYAKSYFAGTVASGAAYLTLIRDGYTWSDHFENLKGGNPATAKTPDYVFAGTATGVALLESKGTRSATLGGFDTTVRDGYQDQVEPHLGHSVGGATATHGYCVGSYMRSTTQAELRIHHTDKPSSGSSSAVDPDLSMIQRHNYATAFTLAHSPQLGADLRRGRTEMTRIPMVRFEWLGRNWLTSLGTQSPDWLDAWDFGSLRFILHHWPLRIAQSAIGFAIEEGIAKTALTQFLDGDESPIETGSFEPLDAAFLARAREERDAPGAVFPDGLAVIRPYAHLLRSSLEPVFWYTEDRRFREM